MSKVIMSASTSNTWVGGEYSQLLIDQIEAMVEKEDAFYSCADYMKELPASNEIGQALIDEGWRQKAAEWMFKVIDHYVSECVVLARISYTCLTSCFLSLSRIWTEIS